MGGILTMLISTKHLSEEEEYNQWIVYHPNEYSNIIKLKHSYCVIVFEMVQEINRRSEIKEEQLIQSKKRQVCKRFVNNNCIYGKICKFLHTADPEIIKQTNCNMIICRRDRCPYNHESVVEEDDEEEVCNICLSDIYKSNKKFGLLLGCNHKFCATCIGRHRTNRNISQEQRLKCPCCRKISKNYFQSNIYLTGALKIQAYNDYKANCKKKNCKYSYDLCPFKERCRYSHIGTQV